MNYKKIVLYLFIAAIGIFAYYKFFVPPAIQITEINQIRDLEGNPVEMLNYKGKPLVLCFWASWCPPCRMELPGLEKIQKELGDKINVVLLSDEPIDHLQRFSRTMGNHNLKLLHSAKRANYGVYSIPTTYFYNGKGKLMETHKDYLDYKSLKDKVVKL